MPYGRGPCALLLPFFIDFIYPWIRHGCVGIFVRLCHASPEAELRLCHLGGTFGLYKRHGGSKEAWTLADSFMRSDLPQSLQVGLNLYTDSAPDLQVRYDHISIDPVAEASDCETP